MKWTSWLAAVVLVGIGAVVVVSSFRVADVRCEVCVRFRGREACRSVEAATEDEARDGAHSNACALLASGVTDSLACQRTTASTTRCGPR
jgi:putative Mn2+ efflux pump MntP